MTFTIKEIHNFTQIGILGQSGAAAQKARWLGNFFVVQPNRSSSPTRDPTSRARDSTQACRHSTQLSSYATAHRATHHHGPGAIQDPPTQPPLVPS